MIPCTVRMSPVFTFVSVCISQQIYANTFPKIIDVDLPVNISQMTLFEHDRVNSSHHKPNGNYENKNKKILCIHFRVCVFVCVSSMLTMSKYNCRSLQCQQIYHRWHYLNTIAQILAIINQTETKMQRKQSIKEAKKQLNLPVLTVDTPFIRSQSDSC